MKSEINKITEKILGCAYTVSNTLGCGFLEKVYENALTHEIRKAGLEVNQQYGIKIHYDKCRLCVVLHDGGTVTCHSSVSKKTGGIRYYYLQ